MYKFEELKIAYTQIKKRTEHIVIGGITFLAATIFMPSVGEDVVQFNFDLSASVEKVIEKAGASNVHTARQLFSSDLLAFENPTVAKWNNELDELAEYEDDWDGDGAMAVQADTIVTAREVLKATNAVIGFLSDIFPTPLGTVCLEWKHDCKIVNVEVTRERIAYYVDKFGDGREVSDYVRASGVTSEFIESIKASIS